MGHPGMPQNPRSIVRSAGTEGVSSTLACMLLMTGGKGVQAFGKRREAAGGSDMTGPPNTTV